MRERLPEFLAIQPEVARAIAERRPVVALESTVLAHGLPSPANLGLARTLEETVREAGAVPATVAVLDGRIRVGLDAEDLERLAAGDGVRKVSRRDLPVVLATGQAGATTVSATMIAAELAGIRVFATGGIGGVHRGGAETFDISADLDELARTNVCVVCAGPKAILDLPKTREVLETRGVPVIGWKTDVMPAFYMTESGLSVDHRVDGAAELAKLLRAKWQLELDGGVLVTVPIDDALALPRDQVEAAITAALAEAGARGVVGKDVTPFLLARLDTATKGRSVAANMALLTANAAVAAEIAGAYVRLEGEMTLPRPAPAMKGKRGRTGS